MRIGIDVDNTITDTLPVLKKYCKEYNDNVIKRNLTMNEKGFAVANLYEWTEEEKMYFINNIYPKVFEDVEAKKNVSTVIRKLKETGNSIYIITARTKIQNPYEITQQMLKRYNIVYDEIIVQKDKKQFCIDNNIDILIDDEPKNINSVSEIIPVIAFEYIYNQECNGKNIIKVQSWTEISDIIKNLKK